jgi:Domain of unknown function (DUF4350)
MKRSPRRNWIVGAIILGTIIFLTLAMAPGAKNSAGSTFGRGPDGYGAWYAFMEKRGTPLERWKRPLKELFNQTQLNQTQPTTVLQIYDGKALESLETVPTSLIDSKEEKIAAWIKRGNTLVVLGLDKPVSRLLLDIPVTRAEFSTRQDSPEGPVKIETTHRFQLDPQQEDNRDKEALLSDRFGAMVWQQTLGKGRVVFAVTPHLGANAYQDEAGNFPFLAKLVSHKGDSSAPKVRLVVDEYLHGYKDRDVVTHEAAQDWLGYLAKTPLLPIFVQGLILLLLFIWAENRRFGPVQIVKPPTVDNSQSYIQALAGVLQKAQSHGFVIDVVGKEEQLQLQRKLGLDSKLDSEALIKTWIEQIGHPADALRQVLNIQSQKQPISDADFINWLEQLQTVRNQTTK